MREFIKKIQNSDEPTKRKWIIICSAISMFVIVVIWLIYFNFSFNAENAQKMEVVDNSRTEFWNVFKTGLKVVWNGMKNKISGLMGSNTIEIIK